MLECALNPEEYNMILACETTKEIWDKLEITHEGTSKVKRSKIRMLKHDYELFLMQPGETIKDMYTRLNNIMSNLKTLGKPISNEDIVEKIL